MEAGVEGSPLLSIIAEEAIARIGIAEKTSGRTLTFMPELYESKWVHASSKSNIALPHCNPVAQLRKTVELDDEFYSVRDNLALALELKGAIPEAIAVIADDPSEWG